MKRPMYIAISDLHILRIARDLLYEILSNHYSYDSGDVIDFNELKNIIATLNDWEQTLHISLGVGDES